MEDFTDFRQGYFGAPEELFMTDRLANEAQVKQRYETAREKRLGANAKGRAAHSNRQGITVLIPLCEREKQTASAGAAPLETVCARRQKRR